MLLENTGAHGAALKGECMEIELKPCPFCGSAASVDTAELFDAIQGRAGWACLAVTCENDDCGARVLAYNHTGGPLPYEVMAKMAAEKWNRRV